MSNIEQVIDDKKRVEMLNEAKKLIVKSADILLTPKGEKEWIKAIDSVNVLIKSYKV